MTVLAVGCSFLCDRGDIIPQCELLSKKLNTDIDNRSIPGNGNTHILYNTIDAILENEKQYSLVLIGWSTPQRWDYVTSPNKWFSIPMLNVIKDHAKNKININDSLFKHWAPNVLMLSTWLRDVKIPFIMWNSLKCWDEGESKIHKTILDVPEFYSPTYCQLDDVRLKKEWISNEDHHPNQQNHERWAEDLLEFYRKIYNK